MRFACSFRCSSTLLVLFYTTSGQGGPTWSRGQGQRACDGGSGDCNGDWERGAEHESGGPRHYGQLRLRYVLGRRRRQAGELGPSDVLIVQPTSVGLGVDHAFMEVMTGKIIMGEKDACALGTRNTLHKDQRIEGVHAIVWRHADAFLFLFGATRKCVSAMLLLLVVVVVTRIFFSCWTIYRCPYRTRLWCLRTPCQVFAASCMPDSVEPCGQAWKQHIESRLESSRVVWPSGQYMDASRAVM